ncbi:ABC transporter ATP-binding protein [Tsuneonella rigui]|jgi:ABC-type multidrug transport system fused ATPase/permease subunit|uniref:ATP-binding cassette domain-containing protein n=1 Tax=Tsuneonella rigui TaxID=1708790 RepID=UPI000F7F0CEF|nr:ABC transporter ATP-binding protein [Tsuneonella rigui]
MDNFVPSLRLLWRQLSARGRAHLVLLLAFLIVSSLAEAVSALALFSYITMVVGHDSQISGALVRFVPALESATLWDKSVYGGAVLLAVFAIKNALDVLTRFLLLRFVLKTYERVATRFFGQLLNRPLERFLTRSIQDYQHSLDIALILFRTVLTSAVMVLVDLALVVVMLVLLVAFVDPVLLLLIVGVLGVTQAVLLKGTKNLAQTLAVLREEALRSLNFIKTDGFRGAIDLRLTNNVGTVVDRYAKANSVFSLSERRVRGMEMLPRAVNEMVIAGAIVLTATYFASGGQNIQSAFPALALLGFVGLRITSILSRMTENLQRVRDGQHVRQLFEREYDLAEQDARTLAPAAAIAQSDDSPVLESSLALDAVSYRYPGTEVAAIEGVSLTVDARSFVGFCGPSGSGKTTLALIAMGLLEPTSGLVSVDGLPMAQVRDRWFRSIGYVGQSPYLSSRSLRENVAFGHAPQDVDDERVWHALELASLADVVRKMPEQLDSRMLDEGGRLSGGQRQRLCIARALYNRPSVIFFDEATSALDPLTERAITEAIHAMRDDRTIISIAHRLSTIKDCDVIHYFEAGSLVASGRFTELTRNVPAFAKLAAAGDHEVRGAA